MNRLNQLNFKELLNANTAQNMQLLLDNLKKKRIVKIRMILINLIKIHYL